MGIWFILLRPELEREFCWRQLLRLITLRVATGPRPPRRLIDGSDLHLLLPDNCSGRIAGNFPKMLTDTYSNQGIPILLVENTFDCLIRSH